MNGKDDLLVKTKPLLEIAGKYLKRKKRRYPLISRHHR
jgi:hypothetical protein